MSFRAVQLLLILFFCGVVLTACFETIAYTENGTYWGVVGKNIAESNSLYTQAKTQSDFGPHIKGVRLDWDQEFPSKWVTGVYADRILPLIVWEPWIWQEKESLDFNQIIEGDFDDYLDRWAAAIYKIKLPVLIDIFSTPELLEYPWHVANKVDSDALVLALNYIQDRFKEKGANNVIWFTYSESEKIRDLLKDSPVQPFTLMSVLNHQDDIDLISKKSKIVLFTDRLKTPVKNARFNPDVEKFQEILNI